MHPVVHRTIVFLSVTYALGWAGAAMAVGPGSATLVELTGDLSHAGLFVALFSVSSAVGAALFGRLMDRFGRKGILIAVHVVAALGYACAGAGASLEVTPLFVTGGSLLAFGFGGVLLTRVAAAEIFPAAQRGRGVGWVQVSAVVGAVLGPVLLMLSDPLGRFLAQNPLDFVWFFAPPLHLAAALLLMRITEPLTIARNLEEYHPETTGLPPTAVPVVGAHVLPIAILALAANQAAMVAVMGVAGAAVHHAGHPVWVLGLIMFLHFVGMFGLSPVVGRVADRFGRRNTILTGITVLAMGAATIALVQGLWGFAIGLLLVGFGWSFGFIGATVLLADITVPHRRARIIGRADLSAQLSAAVVALTGGYLFALHGVTALGLLAVAIVLVPLIGLFFVRPIRAGDAEREKVPPR